MRLKRFIMMVMTSSTLIKCGLFALYAFLGWVGFVRIDGLYPDAVPVVQFIPVALVFAAALSWYARHSVMRAVIPIVILLCIPTVASSAEFALLQETFGLLVFIFAALLILLFITGGHGAAFLLGLLIGRSKK